MKFLIDNNLSFKLKSFGESVHVRKVVGIKATDLEIWNYAKEKKLIILTKDNDFDELSQMNGCPPKVVHLNCGNKSTTYISNLLTIHEKEIKMFVDKSDDCLMKIFSD